MAYTSLKIRTFTDIPERSSYSPQLLLICTCLTVLWGHLSFQHVEFEGLTSAHASCIEITIQDAEGLIAKSTSVQRLTFCVLRTHCSQQTFKP